MPEQLVNLDSIRSARAAFGDAVKLTPLDLSATFSRLCGRQIHFKLENLQKTGSFKVRGALNKLRLLSPEARRRGVITASAGNHAQGVAYAARAAGVHATVVMPETAAFSKVNATTDYGAEVLLHGSDYSEAFRRATQLAKERGSTFVHAFDDADVIAGQGTVALEILEQLPEIDTLVVPVGGGGLLAGTVAALRGMRSAARVVAVQAAGASSLAPSLRQKRRVEIDSVDTIADGLATRAIGELPFRIIGDDVAQALEVSDAEIAEAVLLLLERTKTVVEAAGAVGLAAALSNRLPADSNNVVVVISGGNIDMNLLDRIINLGLIHEGRLFRFTTRLSDRPGELQRLVTCIATCRANIHQIAHERAQPGLPLTQASVTLDLETRGRTHIGDIKAALAAAGFDVQ
ncbi:MAG: threonine ammonia-lyase [Deltaproteobacteria bacterium]|nr:threonine ammonia-lyase [Deltaproteobacteria bacterium]